jgi:hypothetical protein
VREILGFALALASIVALNVLNYYPQAHGITSLGQIAAYSARIIPVQYLITVLLLVGIHLMFDNGNSIWFVIVLMSLVGVIGKLAGGYINYSHIETTRGELMAILLIIVAAVVAKGVK